LYSSFLARAVARAPGDSEPDAISESIFAFLARSFSAVLLSSAVLAMLAAVGAGTDVEPSELVVVIGIPGISA
jgi:hypothetical protein